MFVVVLIYRPYPWLSNITFSKISVPYERLFLGVNVNFCANQTRMAHFPVEALHTEGSRTPLCGVSTFIYSGSDMA